MSPFLAGFTWLLLFQCAGEAIVYVTGLPIPGHVLGMALTLAARTASVRGCERRQTILASRNTVAAVPAIAQPWKAALRPGPTWTPKSCRQWYNR